MTIVKRKGNWVVYGDDGKVIIISHNRDIAIKYAKEQTCTK